MNAKWMTGAIALAAALAFPVCAVADNDVDLPINGDFLGQPSGYSPAPGWTLTADGGNARILPTNSRDDFILELRAAPNRSQSVVSDLHALPGYMLKLEVKLSGAGTASAGYEAFDATRTTLVSADRQTVALSGYDQKVKRYFPLPAQAKYVRIRLTAEAGSTALFRDVDADVAIVPAAAPAPGQSIAAPAPAQGMAAPAPGQSMAAPAPAQGMAAPAPAPAPAQGMAAPAPVSAPAPAAAPAPAPAPAAAPAPAPAARPVARMLQNDKYYAYMFLGKDEHYEISLTPGSDIDFELGESVSSGCAWRVVSYDPAICRVKIEHDQDGVFPFRRDKAEIELKALGRGTTVVVFSTGEKTFTVHFTSM